MIQVPHGEANYVGSSIDDPLIEKRPIAVAGQSSDFRGLRFPAGTQPGRACRRDRDRSTG